MGDPVYLALSVLLGLGVLLGIRWMSRVETAPRGNRLSALCMLAAVLITLFRLKIWSDGLVLAGLALGSALGLVLTVRVKMIAMPQAVGLLNGLGGAASAIAALLAADASGTFAAVSRLLAIVVGGLTFSGSLVAAAKLQGLIPSKPVLLPGHSLLAGALLALMATCVALAPAAAGPGIAAAGFLISLLFGVVFAVRVGGADMPITISLLNSTSGVAASIAGMAVGDILLVAVGSVVGASGLLLTRIMCAAMNRSLSSILFARGRSPGSPASQAAEVQDEAAGLEAGTDAGETPARAPARPEDLGDWILRSQSVVIIPGYGMAAAQAQGLVRQLSDRLFGLGKTVRFAIHPVAGRMPGHMNVLLAEADIPYDMLYEMDAINDDLGDTDLVIAVGANDVINPAANTAVDTPIYGMPVLAAERAKRLVIMNYDLKPGYAGVPNPLYEPSPRILLLLGDAKDSLQELLGRMPDAGA